MREEMMKKLLMGLMLLVTAGAAGAEWTAAGGTGELIQYVDRATIRKSGNLVKMWDLADYKTVQTSPSTGVSYFSDKGQREYDCKEEKRRLLAFTWFDGKMGSGKVVHNTSETSMKWSPLQPGSIGEALWKIACGKK